MNVGVLGGGQLARMLALAGHPLGLGLLFVDPSADACAAPVGKQLLGAYDDPARLEQLAQQSDVITYEFENVPSNSLEYLAPRLPVYPPVEALATGQDRLLENRLFQQLEIPIPDFLPVDSLESLQQAIRKIGLPAVLKTRREGYDGKGQAVIRNAGEAPDAWQSIGRKPAIFEAFVPFEREVSIIAVRDKAGRTRCYPLTENTHQDAILFRSIARPGDPLQALAERHIERLLEHLDYVGVLALELFQAGDRLLANEFAPRVHNSGHWTIEGAETSQFENHLRAVSGLPLGSTEAIGPAAMLNCIGSLPAADAVLSIEGAHLHDYGKSDRPGRKVGHITLRARSETQLIQALEAAESLVNAMESATMTTSSWNIGTDSHEEQSQQQATEGLDTKP